MTLDPFVTAPIAIQLHAASALLALVLAPIQLLRRPGGKVHKRLGYVWVCAMAITSVSSFWIHELRLVGPFSPIHALSVYVLVTLVAAVVAARRGNIVAHRRFLQSCAFWGLGVAGLFTLMPGRRMSMLLFPDAAWAVFGTAAALLLAVSYAVRARHAGMLYARSARSF